jgi:hypothetical protein
MLITLVEGGLSRPFEILPREWRACRLLSSIGGALANVRHRRVGTVSSLSSIELTLNGAAALTGKTQSAHQERHQYWIAIAMQPFCQTSEATHHAVPPAAPIIRSRWLPWFSLVARWCCFITESSMFGLNPSEVFGVILTHFDLREVSVDDEMTARVQRKLFWKLASACLVC